MSLQPHILVIEDNLTTRLRLVSYLRQLQYRVSEASDAAQAEAILAEQPAEVLIVDINLDGKDGLQITREQRARSNVGIILLTARTEQVDRIVGLELGADDYVAKPYSPREVVARVKAVLRRGARRPEPATVLTLGKLSLDNTAHSAELVGKPLELTPTEFGILQLLVSQPGRVFTRLQLLEAAQGTSYEGYERSVDVHVKNLRRKLKEADPGRTYIETVFGVGYRASRIES